jgi:hypothetical protein
MKTIAECKIRERGYKICREEEGKSICFEQEEYEIVCDIVPVEKCVLTRKEDGKRCDFLFLFEKDIQEYKFLKTNAAYYVELKGTHLVDACEQLLNSITKTIDQLNKFDINALVISSREFIPKYDNNEFYRNVKRLIKKDIQFKIMSHTVCL